MDYNQYQQPSPKSHTFVIITVIILVIIISVIALLLWNYTSSNSKKLSSGVCEYDKNKYLTCGTSYVLISEGKTYNITANKPFLFPQGDRQMVGLTDPTIPTNKSNPRDTNGTYLLFLKEGQQEINEETSRKAVGSFIAER